VARRLRILGLLLVGCASHEAPPPWYRGELAAWISDPVPRTSCQTVPYLYYPGGRGPFSACSFERDGRERSSFAVGGDSVVVSATQRTIVAPHERERALRDAVAALAPRLGAATRCPQSAYWQRDGWYVLLHLRAGTDVGNAVDTTPWELARYVSLGTVLDAFKCRHPTVTT
jgi:hypothetical protein